MAVPLNDETRWLIGLGVGEVQRDQFVVLDDWFTAVVQQLGCERGSDTGRDCSSRFISGQNRVHDSFFNQLHVVRVDAALQLRRSPEAERVGAFMVVRTGDEDVAEPRYFFSDAQHERVKQADYVDGSDGDFVLTMSQDYGTNHDRVMYAGRFA